MELDKLAELCGRDRDEALKLLTHSQRLNGLLERINETIKETSNIINDPVDFRDRFNANIDALNGQLQELGETVGLIGADITDISSSQLELLTLVVDLVNTDD